MKQIALTDVKRLKRQMRAAGVTYQKVADLTGVSWHFVWCVVNARKKSARVRRAIEYLIVEQQQQQTA